MTLPTAVLSFYTLACILIPRGAVAFECPISVSLLFMLLFSPSLASFVITYPIHPAHLRKENWRDLRAP